MHQLRCITTKRRLFLFRWLGLSVLAFLALGVPVSVGATAPIIFEVPNAIVRGPWYGGTGGTGGVRIAQKYIPPENQEVCAVEHATQQRIGDGVVMNLMRGGSNPDNGQSLLFIYNKDVAPFGVDSPTYARFEFPHCLTLDKNQLYWFRFEPKTYSAFGGTFPYYRASDLVSYSSYWRYDGFTAFGGGGWKEDLNREYSLKLEGPEPPPKKQPVIIVPGILGSRLSRVSDGEEVWPNMDEMKRFIPKDSYLSQLILDVFGKETEISRMNPVAVVEDVAGHNVYGNLIKSFVDLGYASGTELFVVPYDWRLSVASSTFRIEEAVARALQESPTGKVSIVAHSMGGLLVKEYLRGVTSTDFIDKLILLGVPELGSPKAFKALTYGDNFGFGFGPVDIFNIERSKIISQNMPGVYELLPSREYFSRARAYIYDATGDTISVPDYDGSLAFMMRDPDNQRNQFLLGKSDQLHSVLDGAGFNLATSSLYRIAGCQNPKTIGMVRVYPDEEFDIDPVDGDGTVPLASATASEVGHAYYALHSKTRIDHMGLAGDERVLGVVKNIITGASSSLAEGITQDATACGFANPVAPNETTLAFSTHSPVLLHLYDDQNRHTGPTHDGDIELGIPGSSYEVIGDNSFAWAPGGVAYRVVIDATNNGRFNAKVKTMSGTTMIAQTSYIAVPLASDMTTATLTVNDLGEASMLALDSDGDSVFEGQVAPTATLTGVQADDVAPPEISFGGLIDGARFAHSDSLVLSITASDALSGVATTSVELDGARTEQNSIIELFDFSLGDHEIIATAIDALGNARRESLRLTVYANKESIERDILKMNGMGWLSAGVGDELVSRVRGLTEENTAVLLNDLALYRDRCYMTREAYEVLKSNIDSLNYE